MKSTLSLYFYSFKLMYSIFQGSATLEGVFLDTSNMRQDLQLRPTIFEAMENLRLLAIHNKSHNSKKNVLFPQGLQYLPDSLSYLDWSYYPLETLPLDFEPQNLVCLRMPYSKLRRLWNGDLVCFYICALYKYNNPNNPAC